LKALILAVGLFLTGVGVAAVVILASGGGAVSADHETPHLIPTPDPNPPPPPPASTPSSVLPLPAKDTVPSTRSAPRLRETQPSESIPVTGTICDLPGQRFPGGTTAEVGKLKIQLPPESRYVVSLGISGGSAFISVCSVDFDSLVALSPDGVELHRAASTAEANDLLDRIVRGVSRER
jgi:hypothetical protein